MRCCGTLLVALSITGATIMADVADAQEKKAEPVKDEAPKVEQPKAPFTELVTLHEWTGDRFLKPRAGVWAYRKNDGEGGMVFGLRDADVSPKKGSKIVDKDGKEYGVVRSNYTSSTGHTICTCTLIPTPPRKR